MSYEEYVCTELVSAQYLVNKFWKLSSWSIKTATIKQIYQKSTATDEYLFSKYTVIEKL